MADVALLVARMVADTARFDSRLKRSDALMHTIGRTGIVMGSLTALGVGAAIKSAGDFQEKMQVLQAVSGNTKDEMAAMSKKAIALGADLKLPSVSAGDAADVMLELTKGGFSFNRTMAATRGVLQLAVAGQIDFTEAAQDTVRVLTAFNLKGSDSVHIADLLANAANATTTDIHSLMLGMQQASASFVKGGQTADDLATSLAIMAQNGITGSDAGTSLKTMMSRLNPQTKKAADAMKALGINVFDAHGKYLPMRDIVQQFSHSLSGLNPKQRQHALYTIFGSDAIRAANFVLGGGVKQYDKYKKKLEQAGTAQKVANAHTKGFNGALQAFVSTVQTLGIVFGTALLPVATQWVKKLTGIAQWLTENQSATKKIVAAFAIMAGVMLTINIAWRVYNLYLMAAIMREALWRTAIRLHVAWTTRATVAQRLQAISIATTGIQLRLLAVRTAVMTGITKAWAAAQWLLNLAMEANPIILIVTLLIALGVALVVAYQHSATFRRIVNGAFNAVVGAAKDVWGWVSEKIPAAFEMALKWVRKHWPVIAAIVAGPFAPLVLLATDAFGVRSKLQNAFQAAVNFVKRVLNGMVNWIGGLPGRLWSAAQRLGSRFVDGLRSGLSSLAGALRDLVVGPLNSVIRAWNGLGIPSFHVHIPVPLAPDIDFSSPSIGLPDLPTLARGGIVSGPMFARIGDNPGGKEAVIPLPQRNDLLGGGGGNVTFQINAPLLTEKTFERVVIDVLDKYRSRNATLRILAGTANHA